MPIDASAPKWSNWSQNLVHEPAADGANYYFRPANLAELKSVLADAAAKGVTVRASGQRHSQAPLVTNDNRGAVPPQPTTYLVDMSCYADLGPDGKDSIVLGPGQNQVTLNPGLREDALDAFLTQHNLMLQTVTAGGFFSIGGMTAVDVHGGTVEAPIFAETASAFTILGADGNETVINEQSKDGDGNALLPFARVSLGALGIVTRITLNVLPRPHANTLQGGTDWYRLANFKLETDPSQFVAKFKELLTGPAKHTRMECFFTPYAAPFLGQSNFLVLWWDVVQNPQPEIPNSDTPDPKTACELSHEDQFGAPLIGIPQFAEEVILAAQTTDPYWSPLAGPAVIAKIALDEIDSQVKTANKAYSELWLAKSSRAIFMSYFIELPGLDEEGLKRTWEGLDVVNTYVTQTGNFHIAAPMEFRFVKGGDSAMSGAFSHNRDAYFVNLDLIGFTEPAPSSEYPAALLKFFAHVERKWVAMGGLPHNGKMFGFYDPTDPAPDSYTPPFNKKFLSFITRQRIETCKAPVDAFKKYRQARDPNGLFYTRYLRDLLED
ncbi:MAG TPA: D-arabinono-1,4-lactone oxidase [Terriglobia bacterium]|nr:D-arabinono-1,4-lactone oxidase [Terriglobia bacterium]